MRTTANCSANRAPALIALTLASLLLATQSKADIVFHSTGEGLSQGDLDPNWTVILPNGTNFGNAISATDPNGNWTTPYAPSTWISTAARSSIPIGLYKYITTFTIDPGIDPSAVELSGYWSVDDQEPANAIYLNGVKVSDFDGGFFRDSNSDPSAIFTIDFGFQTGLNTLEFWVENGSGPGGTLIRPIPEPATLTLITAVVLCMVCYRARSGWKARIRMG